MALSPQEDERHDDLYTLTPDEPSELTWEETLRLRFGDKTDEEIVGMAQDGDRIALEYLLSKYKNFVRSKARSYFLIGADHEDIVQEGMIGLFKSIRDYQLERLSSFRAFAELCITRQIITAIKTATRKKHGPLNSYISLNRTVFDGAESDRTLIEVLESVHVSDPEELLIGREDYDQVAQSIEELLTKLERSILELYLLGYSYQQIAETQGRSVKCVDNAIQRIKKKLTERLRGARRADAAHGVNRR
mgnify:CR=1 FL=1